MDDIDPETLRAYRMEYELRNPDHVFNTLKKLFDGHEKLFDQMK